ncbi:MAG TPA: CDP-diacylglycerol--glycerol-3-phosphate 3-phosphatidyltransferase [bacterium]|nr:CDP-diacylglycerol--glycerol-3-phosphate 3-phosphatidyltransferase [bacterium]HOL47913.1 CDP-diacylglycerol--glycerol-3-phosphate 3-phosphatidyltransferase [bacterium]HPQ19228.1 CDP-diacylglycerol--glycerol-3-phosphate 3-phosphatidyltransferase [bacterium]
MNLANRITLSRVLVVPIFVLFFYNSNEANRNFLYAWIIYIYCGITDVLDGYIARKYKQITEFGKFLDPLADKILNLSAFIISIKYGMPQYIVAIIFIKEFLQFLGYSYLKFRIDDVIISPSKLGKLLTILQFTIINYMFINLANNNFNFSKNIYFKIFIIIFIILLGIGLLQYSLHGLRQLYGRASDIKIEIPEKIKQILKI